MFEDFLPHKVGPVGCYRGKEKGLQLDVVGDEVAVHANSCGGGGFPVEISAAYEVVQSGLEGKLVIGPASVLVTIHQSKVRILTLRNAAWLR